MPQIATWLLANIFSALLPSPDPDERDFYDILGVSRDASNEGIRKAYKKKSLQLHPDKVAQRRGNKEEAAQEYELVQEAYGVLVNEEKRQRYHALNCSPTRFRFVHKGALHNPGALYENLTNAKMSDKTRLVVLCTVMILILFIQPILFAAKVNHIVEHRGGLQFTKWTVLLIPLWLMGALWIVFSLLLLVLAPMNVKLPLALSVTENFFWYLGAWFLAKKWDHPVGTWWTYPQVLVPVYLAMIFHWISMVLLLLTIRRDVRKMITVEYLEREVLQDTTLEDMTPEEQEDLRTKYLVVTVPDDFEPVLETPAEEGEEPKPLTEDELEAQKIEASPEYQSAIDAYNSTMGGLIGSLIFVGLFLLLLSLKLDRRISATYWVVFIPIWLYIGSRWAYNLLMCTCTTITSDHVIMQMPRQNEEDSEEEDDDDERPEDSGCIDPKESVAKFNKSDRDGVASLPLDGHTGQSGSASGTSQDEAKVPEEGEMPVQKTKGSKKNANKKMFKTDATTNADSEGGGQEVPLVNISLDEGARSNKNDDDDDDVEKGDEGEASNGDNVHIDEETFRAWQSAYEDVERSAMEEQANACVQCCNLTWQLIILFMVVAKMEKAFDLDRPPNPTEDHHGFNTFWILFPFFLFFGIILCCCACVIYGAAPGSADDLYPAPAGESDDTNNNPTTTTNDAATSNNDDVDVENPAPGSTPIVLVGGSSKPECDPSVANSPLPRKPDPPTDTPPFGMEESKETEDMDDLD